MDRATKIDMSVVYAVREALHREGCNTIEPGYQEELYRDEVPFYVRVVEGWPDFREEIYLPTIAVYSRTRTDRGLQIGGNYYVDTLMYVDIFATRDNEKNFLKTTIFEYLNDRDLYIYNYGDDNFPLFQIVSGESTITEYYPSGVAIAESTVYFDGVTVIDVPPLDNTGNVDNHRAQLTFTAVSTR